MSSAVTFGSFLTTNALTASPELGVRHADHGAFQHAGVAGDHFLDLVRIDVEAGDQDHVLLAVDDLGVAVRVHHADVAGAEIAVRRSSPSRSRPACSSSRPSPAGPWRRFRRPRRAALRCRHRRGSKARSRARECRSSRRTRSMSARIAGQRRRGFRQAIAFRQCCSRSVFSHCSATGLLRRHAAADRDLQLGEIELVELRVYAAGRCRAC